MKVAVRAVKSVGDKRNGCGCVALRARGGEVESIVIVEVCTRIQRTRRGGARGDATAGISEYEVLIECARIYSLTSSIKTRSGVGGGQSLKTQDREREIVESNGRTERRK